MKQENKKNHYCDVHEYKITIIEMSLFEIMFNLDYNVPYRQIRQ